ncbi:2-C-methyl-D-erythritol 4-phosphate cytidylyltransferase [Thomasclavelia cocleata]|jgi:hypothetical protein|uniref:2-C-methyl-D-erythritol 4-phosphate cytidylyltransferase n=1 Tax=Thomasclavelia cocleata TaxID=69824 RepID=UPI00241E7C04|nr:2-C-methyl-D-erythritol 4-phosphate cytidylyltransferase [Thomasclavelia cocleata]MCI9631541.1 2-C-methyl-D-erythritol 4-phosphate cytidylyltransferase [Thomasclavelia cocleata]
MFIKAVQNNRGRKGTYYCSLVEAYRENSKIKHRTIRSFGLLTEEQLPYLKAMYAKKKPRLVYDDD